MNLKQEKRYLQKRIEGIEGAISVHQDAIDFRNPCDVEIKCRQEYIKELMVDLEAYRSYLNFLTKSMGKWVSFCDDDCGNECSKCGYKYFGGKYKFCPNCGAKMEKI